MIPLERPDPSGGRKEVGVGDTLPLAFADECETNGGTTLPARCVSECGRLVYFAGRLMLRETGREPDLQWFQRAFKRALHLEETQRREELERMRRALGAT